MSHSYKLSRRIGRFRAPVFAVLMVFAFGCNDSSSFSPDSSTQPDGANQNSTVDDDGLLQAVPVDGSSAAISFAGGIPIGLSAQPIGVFGSTYNGALKMIYPQYLLKDLAAIKAQGGRVLLNMSGGMRGYTNADGTFSLSKWKAQIDKYRNVNFDSYIKDGTLIGHYMIDEPHHAAKYGGKAVSGATLEEMAQYSKARYPSLPTVVRTLPTYLEKWAPYRHLDAAFAIYAHRFGDVDNYIAQHVASAKKQGLGLVVGLNLLDGGNPKRTPVNAQELEQWGSALLSSTYPCAFLSWKYDSDYLRGSGIQDAMRRLRGKAENRSAKSCSGS